MRDPTFHEVEQTLVSLDLEMLQEMAYQMAVSHAAVCAVTSKLDKGSHASDQETRDRVNRLDREELVTILAPSAWVSARIHTHIAS